jgi:hypothetical protein
MHVAQSKVAGAANRGGTNKGRKSTEQALGQPKQQIQRATNRQYVAGSVCPKWVDSPRAGMHWPPFWQIFPAVLQGSTVVTSSQLTPWYGYGQLQKNACDDPLLLLLLATSRFCTVYWSHVPTPLQMPPFISAQGIIVVVAELVWVLVGVVIAVVVAVVIGVDVRVLVAVDVRVDVGVEIGVVDAVVV